MPPVWHADEAMTTFDLRQLTLGVGEALEREETLELNAATIGGQVFQFDPPNPVGRLGVARATTGTVFTLSFEVSLSGPCMRCLEDATTDVSIDASEYQAIDATADPDELESPYVSDDILDLSSWARDAVILALPDKILCRDECAGLCPSCGRRLDEGSCECGPPPPDNRWSKLEELRAQLGES